MTQRLQFHKPKKLDSVKNSNRNQLLPRAYPLPKKSSVGVVCTSVIPATQEMERKENGGLRPI
jgi:hypothetical protein